MKKHKPTDATIRNVKASNARDKAMEKRVAKLEKRLDTVESLIDHGLGKFRKD